jgi:hypothetical protein
MPKIKGRFHEVRAWGGVPGVEVTEPFARALHRAGVPVSVYTKRKAVTRQGFINESVGAASWGSGPIASAGPVYDDDIGEIEVEPEIKGYNVATPLALLDPDAQLAIWVAFSFEPDELQSIFRLQETDARGRRDRDVWAAYLRDLRDQGLTEEK